MFPSNHNGPRSFYFWSGIFLLTGWAWLLWSIFRHGTNETPVCMVKNTTGIPCPSCGSTTSVIHLSNGQWQEAWQANPLGYILAVGLILLPLWWLVDRLAGRSSMHAALFHFDQWIRKRPHWLLLILLILFLNWIWNVMKA